MARLIIPRGLAGSGKTTRLKMVVRTASYPIVRVSRDDLRDMLFGTRLLDRQQEDAVTVAERSQVESFLKSGVSVIVDAMHLRSKYVREWAKVAARCGASFEVWDEFLQVPLEQCIENDRKREGTPGYLGEDVIRGIHGRFFPIPKLDLSGIEPVVGELYVPNPELPKAYMVDIDGTCTTGPCNRSPYEWAKVGQDKPRTSVVETVKALHSQGYSILFCSGRDAVCRPETTKWIVETFDYLWNGRLFMRKEGDMRKDSIVKLELFNEHIRNNFKVIAVFDDRPQVIRMWNSIGLQVFDVAQSEEF